MSVKILISRYLAAFWAVLIVAFLALQVANDLAHESRKLKDEPSSEKYFLLASHPVPAPDLAPDLKALQIWFQHEAEVFVWIGKPGIKSFYGASQLRRIKLIRLLRTSISINAP